MINQYVNGVRPHLFVVGFLLSLFPFELGFTHQYDTDITDTSAGLLEAGRFDEIDRLISDSEIKNDTVSVLTLKARRAFYSGYYADAVSFMQKAFQLDTSDKEKASLVLYYSAVEQNASDFIEKESEHFIIRVKEKDAILLKYTYECMEQIYRNMGAVFNQYPSTKIVVEIYPDKQSFSLASTLSEDTLERSGAIGICKFHRLMILSPRMLLLGYRWMDALSHEYTHLLINHLSYCNTPLWLHEGTARFYELRWRIAQPTNDDYLTDGTYSQLKEAVEKNTLIPFKRMHPSMVYLTNQDEVSLAFTEVASMIDYLTQQFGQDVIIRLLKTFRTMSHRAAFKKIFHAQSDELEKKWINYVRKLPEPTSAGALKEKMIFDMSADEISVYVGADAAGDVRLGDKFRKNNKHELAVMKYKDALKEEPDNAVILVKMARSLKALGKTQEVLETLKHAVKTNPNYVTAYEVLGEYEYNGKNYSEALTCLQEANAINPFNPHTHKYMGLIYYSSNNQEGAMYELTIAYSFMPFDNDIAEILKKIQ